MSGDHRDDLVHVNLNDECEVVLRQRGVDAIRKHYAWLGMDPPECEVGGVFREQFWWVMMVMGRVISHGSDPPFDTTITIRRKV